jgi:hypothetical protein
MAINFDFYPYFDDFDPSLNYHRILFKPGVAVQARELTQTQSILQDQISKFADNIFAQNTPVTGGQVTTNLNCYYVKLNSTYQGSSINVLSFIGKNASDSTGTINGRVLAATAASGGDAATIIISYESGTQFSDGNTILFNGVPLAQAVSASSTGQSSIASISQGVFYITGNYTGISGNPVKTGTFVQVNPQTVILNKYSSSPNTRIGLAISENIVTFANDPKLLDPAQGASNYQAPGADRYQITLTLQSLPLTLGNDSNFIELARVVNGSLFTMVDGTVYSVIDDYFAKRTFETNGDYVVNDFPITPVANTTSSNQYDINIGKGTAYVHGYRLDNKTNLTLTNSRARTTAIQNTNPVYINYGQLFYVDTVSGVFDVSTSPVVDLHCVPSSQIVSTNNTTYSSTLVGKGFIRNLAFDHANDVDANTSAYVYKSYVYDISANVLSGSITSATPTTITINDTTGKFSSVANAYFNTVLTIDSGPDAGDVRNVLASNGITKTLTVDIPFTVTPTSASGFSIRFQTYDVESVVVANSTYNVIASSNINVQGKVSNNPNGDTIYENVSTQPELIFSLGYPYVNSIYGSNYSTTKVFRNVALNGTFTLPGSDTFMNGNATFGGGTGTLSSSAIKQNYTVINQATGKVLDFCSTGNTVVVTGGSTPSAVFTSSLYTGMTVTVISNIQVANSDISQYTKNKTLVSGNTTTAAPSGAFTAIDSTHSYDSTGGQVYIIPPSVVGIGQNQSLYVSDVKRIVKIIDTKTTAQLTAANLTPFLTNSSYDISANYSFNTGQKDSMYDHAYITLNPGAPVPTGGILIVFDYYSHTAGDGFFTVNSYSNESYARIPTYTSKNGTPYNLRDCIDFRPTRKPWQFAFAFEYQNQSIANDLGMYVPQDSTYFYSNYSYYLGRKDKLILSKDKSFQIIQGNPSINPILPTEPNGSLVIANLTHTPYTAYLPSEAPIGVLPSLSMEKVQHKRWTMNDISNLQTQVNNIEYYTTLNLLEKNATTLQVPDVNGLNRFKNGILVDDFSSYGTADTANPDFSAVIDRVAKQMTASQTITNYPLQSSYVLNSIVGSVSNAQPKSFSINNIGKTTNYFSLPYTTANVIVQQYASNTVNLNPFTSPIYSGVMNLNPPMDNWVDNTVEPDLLLVDPNLQVYQQSNTLNTLNVTNWQSIPGTQYTTTGPTTYTIGHGINASPYGYLGYSTTQVNTYASSTQQTTLGYWSNLGKSYTNTNGYITDVSIQAYIRPQQLIFRSKGLKTNTPVSVYFDGVNVNQYIIPPEIIELTGVTGTFMEDDVIGYYNSLVGLFYPLATVVDVYNYPNSNGTKVRLYVTSNFHSNYLYLADAEASSSVLSNSALNSSGVLITGSASGTAATNNIISLHNSGYISSVGGTYTDNAGNPSKILYRAVVPGYSSFANAFGIWGNQALTSETGGNVNTSFNVAVPTSGTYYFQAVCDENGSVTANGVTTTFTNEYVPTVWSQYLLAGTTLVNIVGSTSSEPIPSHDAHLAVAISSGPWTTGTPQTSGQIIFASSHPTAVAPTGVGTITPMTGGGAYFTGVTQVALNSSANSTTGFYGTSISNGCTINFTTTYVSQPIAGVAPQKITQNYTATITAYDGPSRIATFTPAVNLSVGVNTLIGGMVTSTYSINGTKTNYLIAQLTGGQPQLCTNETGSFTGIFSIPQGTFRTGERVLRVDNRTTPLDGSSASTWAEATFTASGLSTKSQSIDFAPSISAAAHTFTQTNYKQNVLINSASVTNPWDPVAQTFIIDKNNYPNGAFLSSINVFFQSKTLTSGAPVTLSIVGTTNGYPNGITLDNSIVTLTPDKINLSAGSPKWFDSSTATTFTFDAPIYIQSGVLYAFILHSQSSDYNVYTAEQNAVALSSSVMNPSDTQVPSTITKIATAPYVGSLFESQNAITWVAQPTKSLMFTVQRCVFDTTQTPTIQFVVPKGLPTRRLTTQDIQSYYNQGLVNNLHGIFTNTNVISDAYNITTTDFVPTRTSINYTYQPYLNTTSAIDSVKSVIPGKFGSPTFDNIYLNDGLKERVLLASANQAFYFNATLSSSDNTVSPFISDDGTSLYNVQWNINNLGLSNTAISLISGGAGYSNVAGNTLVTFSAPDVVGGTQAYGGATVNATGNVTSVYVTTPGSGYLNTPKITITGSNTAIASSNAVSEFSPKGGNSLSRYVTKKVTLTPGNDSGDLRVYFTAYRPPNTNIYVFYRIQNSGDTQTFESGNWQLMTYINGTGTAFSTSRTNTMEFVTAPGINNVANNQVSYASTLTGTTFNTFNQFAIKVVMTTPDTTIVPYITDIRVLALPQGTGI